MICSGEKQGETTFSFYVKKHDSSDKFSYSDLRINRVFDVIHSEYFELSNGPEYLRGSSFLVSLSYLTRLE